MPEFSIPLRAEVKPRGQLVRDRDTGDLCLQVNHGSNQATLPLPFGFGRWDDDRQKAFIEMATKEMTANLRKMRRDELRKLRG